MKSLKLLLPPLLILAVATVIAYQILTSKNDNDDPQTADSSQPLTLAAQTNEEGAVSIQVIPHLRSNAWEFEIYLDTHSVELNEDIVVVSILSDNNGNTYNPLSWNGDPPGGHHRSGTLVFAPVSSIPKSITLRISQVGGVPERSFTWELP